jgi:hypothetical protein
VSDEPVDDPRESSDFLLLALWRAGPVPIFCQVSVQTVSISLLIYAPIFCHVSSFRLLFFRGFFHPGLCWATVSLASLLHFAAALLKTATVLHIWLVITLRFIFNQCEIDPFKRPVSIALGTFFYVSF